MSSSTNGHAVLELDPRDLPDLHARHADGLAASRLHRLRVLQGHLDSLRRGLDEREAHPLLGEDRHHGGGPHHEQADDGQELPPVDADRVPHGPALPGAE